MNLFITTMAADSRLTADKFNLWHVRKLNTMVPELTESVEGASPNKSSARAVTIRADLILNLIFYYKS